MRNDHETSLGQLDFKLHIIMGNVGGAKIR